MYNKIAIYKEAQITRVNGKPQEGTPTLYRSCFAKMQTLRGSELYSAMNAELTQTLIFDVRYCALMDAMFLDYKGYFIRYKNQDFKIYDMDFLNGSKIFVRIRAEVKS